MVGTQSLFWTPESFLDTLEFPGFGGHVVSCTSSKRGLQHVNEPENQAHPHSLRVHKEPQKRIQHSANIFWTPTEFFPQAQFFSGHPSNIWGDLNRSMQHHATHS